MRRHTDILLGY